MKSFGLFAVADSASFELTYAIPHDLDGALGVGQLCIVPVQNRKRVAVYLGPCGKPTFDCKDVIAPLHFTRPFSPVHLQLVHWMSEYYLAPLGRTIRLLGPGFLWKDDASDKRTRRMKRWEGQLCEPSHEKPQLRLTELQSVALETIFSSQNKVTLLHGVTGSGKTEVYIAAARRVLEAGKNVLILVPEIALTPQMSERFRMHFGGELAVAHSGLTPVEYEKQWFRAHLKRARVVLGVRSAVFSPLENIGLIVVDEEHDPSYKCDEFPCYHARDVAVKRATLEGAICILGSATPSLESYFNATRGKYQWARLSERAVGALPEVSLIDARSLLKMSKKTRAAPSRTSFISFHGNLVSPHVVDSLLEVKRSGGQSMIILNRRGFANFALCGVCGNALRCPHCSVTTTLHKKGKLEICHYCGFQRNASTRCLDCGHEPLILMGAGTQNLEDELARLCPELRVARLDRDVMTSNTRLSALLNSFRNHEFDCLVGTQILAKGHDFSKVTLAAILHVEDGLFLPDFRSGERTFQLITQAAGRAGRGLQNGRVILQSLVPEHPVVQLAMHHDTSAFLVRELEARRLGWLPPISRQILFEFSHRSESEAFSLGSQFREALVEHWKTQGIPHDRARIVGPYPAALEKLRQTYRFHLCIASAKELLPYVLVPRGLLLDRKYQGKMRCDVDPYSFL